MSREEPTSEPEGMRSYHIRSSPFLELDTPFDCWEAAKMMILLPFVLVRIVAMALLLLVFAAVSSVAVAGWPIDVPLCPWRRNVVLASRWLGGLLLLLLGFWVQVDKPANIQKALKDNVRILVFNHTSWVDTIVLLFLFAPSGVSRAANAEIPVVGTCIRSFQNINVPSSSLVRSKSRSRQNLSGSQHSTTEPLQRPKGVVQQVADRLQEPGWPIIGIAPEGTTGNGKTLLQFRTGAFVHGVPVLPVCLSYSKRRVNPAWTLGNEPWHFLRLMCQFVNVVHVDVLPVYAPSSEEASSPALFAENVRSQMAAALNVPLVEQSHTHYKALAALGITTDWRGKLVVPKGLVDDRGCVDLQPNGAGH